MTSTYALVTALWILFTASTAWAVVADQSTRDEIRRSAIPLGALLVVAAAIVFAATTRLPLYGLEYEDAFEYAYSGLLLARHPEARQFALNPVCVDGSLLGCNSMRSLSHPTGLAVLVSWLAGASDISVLHVAIVSAVLWSASAAAVFFVARRLGVAMVQALAGSVSLAAIPVWLTLGSSSLSEPAATGVSAWVLLASYQLVDRLDDSSFSRADVRKLVPPSLCIVSGVALAACVKREQLILALALPLLHTLRKPRPALTQARLSMSVGVLGTLGAAIAVIATRGEILHADVIRPTLGQLFSWRHLVVLGPKYLSHLLDWNTYNVLAPVVLISVLSTTRRREAVALLGFAFAYMTMFCSFAQTYYFEKFGQIPWFHFQRYTLEIAPCLALLFALGLEIVWEMMSKSLRRPTIAKWSYAALLVSWLGSSLHSGVRLRRSFSDEESRIRIGPVRAICRLVTPDSWTITAVPLLYALSCGSDRRVISLSELGRKLRRSDLEERMRTSRLFLHEQAEQDRQRYPAAYRLIYEFVQVPVAQAPEYRLVELKKLPAAGSTR